MGFFDHHIISTSLPISTLGWMHTEKWQWHPPPCWLFRSLNRDVLVEDGIAAIAAALVHAAGRPPPRRSRKHDAPGGGNKKRQLRFADTCGARVNLNRGRPRQLHLHKKKEAFITICMINTNKLPVAAHAYAPCHHWIKRIDNDVKYPNRQCEEFYPVISLHRSNSITRQHLSISI